MLSDDVFWRTESLYRGGPCPNSFRYPPQSNFRHLASASTLQIEHQSTQRLQDLQSGYGHFRHELAGGPELSGELL